MREKSKEEQIENLSVSQTVFLLVKSQFIQDDFGHRSILFLFVAVAMNGD